VENEVTGERPVGLSSPTRSPPPSGASVTGRGAGPLRDQRERHRCRADPLGDEQRHARPGRRPLSGVPRCRIGEPDHLDSTLFYLVSPDSDFVTGTIVRVDEVSPAD